MMVKDTAGLALRRFILGGGEKLLSPERRFDQTIYFTLGSKGKK
jgi:hypothetical protein